MMRTPRSICWLCLVVGVGSPSCAGEPGGEKTLSQEQFLAILKARGEFKQPDGAYTIKVKRVGGGKLVGVEVSFEASDGGTAKVSSDLGVLKFNDKNEVELYCEKCE